MKYFLIVAVFAIGFFFLFFGSNVIQRDQPAGEHIVECAALATGTNFVWRYGELGVNPDGLPRTHISLEATCADGKAISRDVDTVDGSCNEVEPQEEDIDMLPHSKKIQCYYAGLGQWFKIVRGERSYEVRRTLFEEALPDQVPPEYAYELVAEFPISQ